jgi:hypothetical protein
VAAAVAVAILKFSQCNVLWGSFQGTKGLILVGALFLPSVAPVSQGGFGVMGLGYLFPYPSHHLGFSVIMFLSNFSEQ